MAHVMRRTARKGLEVLRLIIYINIYVYIIVFAEVEIISLEM